MQVSCIVPTYNRPDALALCIQSLLKQDFPAEQYEIVISDDGSRQPVEAVVQGIANPRSIPIRCVRHQNRGAAYTRNQGARAARGELFVFVDDDVITRPDFLTRHTAALQRFGHCCVNGPAPFTSELQAEWQQTPFGRFRLWMGEWDRGGMRFTPIDAEYADVSSLTSMHLGIRAKDYWAAGGFDEAFPHAGCEDQEFGYRVLQRDWRLIFDHQLIVGHNDRRLTMHEYGLRQERGVMGAVLIWHKWRERRDDFELVRQNRAIKLNDGPVLIGKKVLKWLLSWSPCMAAMRGGIRTLEKLVPQSRLLQRAYWILTGVYLFRGFREGSRRFGALNDVVGSPVAQGERRNYAAADSLVKR